MKPEKLMDCIGQIDDSIIAEADISLSKNKTTIKIRRENSVINNIVNNIANMMIKKPKWLVPAAACLALAIAVTFTVPNLVKGPGTDGKIIVGSTIDKIYSDASSEEFIPIRISPALQDAIDFAKTKDLIKTVVTVPGFWEYRYTFEVDGITYSELLQYATSGVWKEGIPPEHAGEKAKFEANPDEYLGDSRAKNLWARLYDMEEAAFAAFKTKAIAELSAVVGTITVTQDEYPYWHVFIANLSPEQIKLLESEGCFMGLWSPTVDDLLTNE